MAQKLAEAKKSDEECKRERRESFIDYGSVSRYWGRAAQQDAFIIKVKPNASVVIITPLLKENNVKNIIDIGCGAGSDAIFLAKQGFNVTALDFSKEALDVAAKRIKKEMIGNVHPLLADAEKIPARNGAFDAALCMGLFGGYGYGIDLDNRLLASEIERILKPGGILLFAGWFSESEVEGLFKNFKPIQNDKLREDIEWEERFFSAVLLLRKNE
ncbi:MAG: class I SAM-dependent methyltransferase [Candidatus Micrarchaeia archaeon]